MRVLFQRTVCVAFLFCVRLDVCYLQIVQLEQSFKISGSGMHRNLLNGVKVRTAMRMENCTLAFRQLMPSGAYVDMDQLPDDVSGRIHATEEFDTEAAEWLSSDQWMIVYSQFRVLNAFTFEENWEYPIHFRYHRPKPGGGHAVVRLHGPEVLIGCVGGKLFDSLVSNEATVRVPCFDHSSLQLSNGCDYIRLESRKRVWDEAEVPVADSDMLIESVLVTVCACLCMTIFLIQSMLRHSDDRFHSKQN